MLRMYLPIAFGVLFLGWTLYHGLIRRDLPKRRHELFLGLCFLALWGAIYGWVLS